MGTAFIHPNLQRRCEGKTRFATYQEAKDQETPDIIRDEFVSYYGVVRELEKR